MKIEKAFDVCDFCYQQHSYYMSDVPFNSHKKVWTTHCTCCWSVMCDDCYKWSINEIQWSILGKYDFVICRSCIVNYWRTTDMQEKLEGYILHKVKKIKEEMKQEIYLITEDQWKLLTH